MLIETDIHLAMSEERLLRGSVIRGYLKFIKKKWGKAGMGQCLKEVGMDEDINEGSYYKGAIHIGILRWIRKEKGDEFLREAGKFTVLNLGIMSWLMRFVDPPTVATKMQENQSEIYKYGRAEVDTSKPGRVLVKFFDLLKYEEEYIAWIGVCEGILEGTKTEGKVTLLKRTLDGEPHAEYLIEYDVV